mgnify:CR=1 FL=1
MKKKIDPRISEYYKELAKKGVKARHAKLLAKLDKKELSTP